MSDSDSDSVCRGPTPRATPTLGVVFDSDSQEVEEAWKEEVLKRLEAYRRGEAKVVSSEEVLQGARRRLGR